MAKPDKDQVISLLEHLIAHPNAEPTKCHGWDDDVCRAVERLMNDYRRLPFVRNVLLHGLVAAVRGGSAFPDEPPEPDQPQLGTRSEVIDAGCVMIPEPVEVQWERDHWVAKLRRYPAPIGYGKTQADAVEDVRRRAVAERA